MVTYMRNSGRFNYSSLLSCRCSWIIERILIRCQDNGSSRYDDKEYFELASKLRREKYIRVPLKIGEQVTIKVRNSP